MDTLKQVFSSPEERSTVVHFHDEDMAKEVLSATIDELVNIVTYRKDADHHFQLCARQMNCWMRANYSDFIHNVGENIYPLIIASEYEPGYEGVGTTFTLFTKDGNTLKIAPTVSTDYEANKALSHVALAIFVILSPHLNNPNNIQWVGKIMELKKHVEICADALQKSTKSNDVKIRFNSLIQIYITFIDQCVQNHDFTLERFQAFTAETFNHIRINMAEATAIQASAILPAMLKWKQMLGPEEWSKLYGK